MDCIFCKIIQGKAPAEIVYQDEQMIAFKDINPKAKIHLLIAPQQHLESVNHLKEEHQLLAGRMILTAQKIARAQGLKNGYKLVFNVGRGGGQIIDHIHLHLLGDIQEGGVSI